MSRIVTISVASIVMPLGVAAGIGYVRGQGGMFGPGGSALFHALFFGLPINLVRVNAVLVGLWRGRAS